MEEAGLSSLTAGGGARTLAARVVARDRSRFVGRACELGLLERCLSDNPPASVVLVHGPGGIGKRSLLRELARRAGDRGLDTRQSSCCTPSCPM